MTYPALIDFEASCLPEYGYSYPIEVAVARVDGTSRTWLIRPSEAWRYWDWSPEAEALHGISHDLIAREGLAPEQVLAELNEFVGESIVYADADLDAYWLEVLAQAAAGSPKFPRPLPGRIHAGARLYARAGRRRARRGARADADAAHRPR